MIKVQWIDLFDHTIFFKCIFDVYVNFTIVFISFPLKGGDPFILIFKLQMLEN